LLAPMPLKGEGGIRGYADLCRYLCPEGEGVIGDNLSAYAVEGEGALG
jgi:hypothetical protein